MSERPRGSISTLRKHSYGASYDAETRDVCSRYRGHLAKLSLQWDLEVAQFRVLTSLRTSELDTCAVRVSASNPLSWRLGVILCCYCVIRNGINLCEACLWMILGSLFACWLCRVRSPYFDLACLIKRVSTLRSISKPWMYKNQSLCPEEETLETILLFLFIWFQWVRWRCFRPDEL
jgi:hypothetical protein